MNTPAGSSVNRTRSGVSVAKYEFPWQVGPSTLLHILYQREKEKESHKDREKGLS
jgi:hypothetical protein